MVCQHRGNRVVAQASHSGTLEVKAGRSGVRDPPQPHSECESLARKEGALNKVVSLECDMGHAQSHKPVRCISRSTL